MVNNKTFELRPISELMAIVKNDLRNLDDQGLIDEGTLIKTVMYCNDRLGIPIREIKQVCIPVVDYKAKLPLNFEKLYYASALLATNSINYTLQNPFDNNFDRDIIYEAEVDRESLGNAENYLVKINRKSTITTHHHDNWISLSLNTASSPYCHASCPNLRKPGKYQISIDGDFIHTPFRTGEIYLMYLGTMQDEEGNILFPFHPMITPYYEWAVKEKVLMDTIFNSDKGNGDLLKLAQLERAKAWLDAFGITTEKGYGEYVTLQRKKELMWYNQYFKFFQ